MTDRLCTPQDLVVFMDRDELNTFTAAMAIESATAIVQSLVGKRIACDYQDGSQELQLARTVTLMLAKDFYLTVFDAYERAYETAKETMAESPHLLAALQLQYSRRAALIAAGKR